MLIEQLPGLLAASATVFVKWLFSFVFRVTLVLINNVCVERRFICVLAELFLYPLRGFPGFVFFLNYTDFWFFWYVCMYVRDIKAFINLIVV